MQNEISRNKLSEDLKFKHKKPTKMEKNNQQQQKQKEQKSPTKKHVLSILKPTPNELNP